METIETKTTDGEIVTEETMMAITETILEIFETEYDMNMDEARRPKGGFSVSRFLHELKAFGEKPANVAEYAKELGLSLLPGLKADGTEAKGIARYVVIA